MKRIFDSSFRYTRSVDTDVRKTFERVRRQQRAAGRDERADAVKIGYLNRETATLQSTERAARLAPVLTDEIALPLPEGDASMNQPAANGERAIRFGRWQLIVSKR